MISTGKRIPLYNGAPVPTSPAPSTPYPTNPPIIPATATTQVDGASRPPAPVDVAELSGGVAQQGGLRTVGSTGDRQDHRFEVVEEIPNRMAIGHLRRAASRLPDA
jgi:hypothetical protein